MENMTFAATSFGRRGGTRAQWAPRTQKCESCSRFSEHLSGKSMLLFTPVGLSSGCALFRLSGLDSLFYPELNSAECAWPVATRSVMIRKFLDYINLCYAELLAKLARRWPACA